MLKFKAKKAKQKIAKLYSPNTNSKIGIAKANKIYSMYIWRDEEYKKEYKFDCGKYVRNCIDKINA